MYVVLQRIRLPACKVKKCALSYRFGPSQKRLPMPFPRHVPFPEVSRADSVNNITGDTGTSTGHSYTQAGARTHMNVYVSGGWTYTAFWVVFGLGRRSFTNRTKVKNILYPVYRTLQASLLFITFIYLFVYVIYIFIKLLPAIIYYWAHTYYLMLKYAWR